MRNPVSTDKNSISVKVFTHNDLMNLLANKYDLDKVAIEAMEEYMAISALPIDPKFSEDCTYNAVTRKPWDISNNDITQARKWVFDTLRDEFAPNNDQVDF